MGRRAIGYAGWLLAVGCLYFFENETATRIMLISTVVLPFFFRLPVFRNRPAAAPPERQTLRVRTFIRQEEDEPGDIREYAPGDPVNRIHWKLSAKRNKWLVRPQGEVQAAEETAETTIRPATGGNRSAVRTLRTLMIIASAGILLPLVCMLFPPMNRSAQALINRLFDASEAVNRYTYFRFSVSPGETVLPAILLLILPAASMVFIFAVSRSRLPALAGMIAWTAAQAYFGLTAPGWINVLLFVLFAIRMAGRPENIPKALLIPTGVLIISLAVILIRPGTDAGIEAASEQARDWLSRQAAMMTETDIRETPAGETEARHVHTQSLVTGEGEAAAGREFRLVTEEEEQISAPNRTDYLRIIGLLLLTIAAVVVPFLPFAWLNSRRKKAAETAAVLRSENAGEAIAAAFQRVVAWLEAADSGAGNIPYREWACRLKKMPEKYTEEFSRCAVLFEEAAYSAHTMTEEQRAQVLRLLENTETIIKRQADRMQRFRLKYREWLWL